MRAGVCSECTQIVAVGFFLTILFCSRFVKKMFIEERSRSKCPPCFEIEAPCCSKIQAWTPIRPKILRASKKRKEKSQKILRVVRKGRYVESVGRSEKLNVGV